MTEILDENYFDQFGKLKITEEGTGFLHIKPDKWEAQLYAIERDENIGCAILGFVGFIFLFVQTLYTFYIFCIIGLGGIIYKRISVRRFRNLFSHGYYQYEIYTDRVVRYTDRKYERFGFSEAEKIKFKNYGIVIIKESNWRNFWLHFLNPRFMIIPNQIQGYEQIAQHIREQIAEE